MTHVSANDYARQVDRENTDAAQQLSRYFDNLRQSIEHGTTKHHRIGRNLTARLVAQVLSGFECEFKKMQEFGNPRRQGYWMKYLREVDPKVAAMETTLAVFNEVTASGIRGGTGISVGKASYAIGIKLIERLELDKLNASDRIGMETFQRLARERSKSYAQQRWALRSKLAEVDPDSKEAINDMRRAAAMGDICLRIFCDNTHLFNIEHTKPVGKRNTTYLSVIPSPEFVELLYDKDVAQRLTKDKHRLMVCKPKPWTELSSGGYLESRPVPAVIGGKRSYRDLLKAKPEVLSVATQALDFYGQTAWRVNAPVLDVIEQLRDRGILYGCMTDETVRDVPCREAYGSTEEDIKEYKTRAREVHDYNKTIIKRAFRQASVLSEAQRNRDETSLYTPYRFDSRGRIYASATGTTQGTDLDRALLEFAEGVSISSPSEMRAFKIGGASIYGFDNVSLEDRLEWFAEHEQEIIASGRDPLVSRFWTTADEKYVFRFLAYCIDYVRVLDGGLSHMPIGQDCTSSGFQFLSGLIRSKAGAELVNLVPNDKPADLYTIVLNRAHEMIGEAKEGLFNGEHALWALQQIQSSGIRISRKASKIVVMPYVYGASTRTSSANLMNEMRETIHPLGSKESLRYAIGRTLSAALEAALEEILGPAADLRRWLKGIGATLGKHEVELAVELPDGFKYMISEREPAKITIDSTYFQPRTRISIYTGGDDVFEKPRYAKTICPNLVHALDATVLRVLAGKLEAQGITSVAVVHDDISVHAIHTERVNYLYREAFLEVMKGSTVIEQLYNAAKELDENTPKPPAQGDYDLRQVLTARYALN